MNRWVRREGSGNDVLPKKVVSRVRPLPENQRWVNGTRLVRSDHCIGSPKHTSCRVQLDEGEPWLLVLFEDQEIGTPVMRTEWVAEGPP